MAQRDKVKELVGRGLNSYHTKALQQVDRIEKKNKEQNHKISILSNELDNDYLTKTEEGSVISLEHSKEGMVYLDELQGNTLVNYCTDGSKELTLNGDIDVEGTFVTTTEGVDNGKVDVMCEGNTLVNSILTFNATQGTGWTKTDNTYNFDETVVETKTNGLVWNVTGIKPNVKYSFIYTCTQNSLVNKTRFHNDAGHYIANVSTYFMSNIGINVITFTTKATLLATETKFKISVNMDQVGTGRLSIKDVMIIEGDWTNKEIPSYFEGMKSVGECEDNKIEILSQNGNLYNYDVHSKPYGNYLASHKVESNGMKVKANNQDTRGCSFIRLYANEDLYISIDIVGNGSVSKKLADNTYIESYIKSNEKVQFKLEKGREYKIELNAGGTYDAEVLYDNIIISKNNYIDFIPRMFNKKEILLNEPLRGLPNGVKDRFVKIGNKCYIERNIKKKVFDGTENWEIDQDTNRPNTLRCDLRNFMTDSKKIDSDKIYCDKFISIFGNSDDIEHIRNSTSDHYATIVLFISKSKLTTIDADGVKEWFSKNNTTLLYQLETPIYEPLEIELTLNTYTNVTHISNNSIIPCTMKIKNSGYNAIIKPSTLYTVALDTNKSGTIGMNLGGAKATTTNNVATITTPATLADDSLRLYGKGIKGSKVRLLEGDKTNWIPSHFEGMKSSFEDKAQLDGTYKMEILMNNENLFDSTKIPDYTGGDMRYYSGYGGLFKRIENKEYILGNYGGMAFILNLPKNKTYKISIKVRNSNGSNTKVQSAIYLNKEMIGHTKSTFTTNVTENVIGFGVVNYNENTDLILYDVILSEVIDEYTERKSNKIQFSSIEPLRGVGDVKDRFVFKDGKLIIQRNIGKHFITKDSVLSYGRANSSVTRVNFNAPNFDTNDVGKIKVLANKYPSGENGKLHGSYVNNVIGITGDKYMRIMLTNLELGISSTTTPTTEHINAWLDRIGGFTVAYQLAQPTYEEIPFELQKIILEGYENGTLLFDTNIPPTSTVTYAGETPIVKATKLNKTEVLNNTNDINDNIVPYLMDMDYRVVCLQLQSENTNNGISMARLFGGTYEMLQRDIQSRRYSIDEYKHRLDAYLDANKITEEEYNKLGDMLNE